MSFDPRHERPLECTGCGQTIIVGGIIDDIDPRLYRGVSCGCRREKPPVPDERARDLAATIANARAAQKTGRSP